jgi:hypothetical protein
MQYAEKMLIFNSIIFQALNHVCLDANYREKNVIGL